MIYDIFNSIADTVGSMWRYGSTSSAHGAFLAGIILWFVIERLLGIIATPLIKATSIAVILLFVFFGVSVFSSFGTYSSVERPAVTIEEGNRRILEEVLE